MTTQPSPRKSAPNPARRPSPLEKRVDRVETKLEKHVGDDESQFEALRKDIQTLGERLGKRMDDMAASLQGQIDKFTLDKVRAEGKAAGIAEATASVPRTPWWLRAGIIGGCGAVMALIGWMASTIWSMETAKVDALQHQPAASVTVNPSPAPAPIQVAPPTPLLPAPPSDASNP